MEVVENLASDPTTNTLDNPDRDYYKDEWYQSFVLALAWQVPIATIIILYLGEAIYSPTKQGGNTKINPLRYLVPNIFVTNWLPISFFMSMTQSIGFGIMLDESQAKRKGLIRVFLLLYLFAMAFLFPFFFDVVINLPIFGGMCCVYIIFVGISLRSQKTK